MKWMDTEWNKFRILIDFNILYVKYKVGIENIFIWES